jgi:uncharacterized secreted protein with C-terminal beta-propeller domain
LTFVRLTASISDLGLSTFDGVCSMLSLRRLARFLTSGSDTHLTPSDAAEHCHEIGMERRKEPRSRHLRDAAKRLRARRNVSLVERLEERAVMAASLLGGLPEALPRFETVEDVKGFLVQKALKDYESQFGQPTYGYYPMMMNDSVASSQLRNPTANESFSGASVPNHSTTNTQVAGVDEADLVETDGSYLYVARNGEVVIASALSGVSSDSGMSVVSRISIDGNVVGEFLAGDRLTVISTRWHGWGVDPMFGRMAVADLPYSPSMQAKSAVTVSVFDVADPSDPELLEETRVDGDYVESRAIGDKVFVIVSNSDLALPPPRMICPDRDPSAIPPESLPYNGDPSVGDPSIGDGTEDGNTEGGIEGGTSDGAAGEADIDTDTEIGFDGPMAIAFASKPEDEPVYRTFGGVLMTASPTGENLLVGDSPTSGRFAYWDGPSCVYEDRDTYLAGITPRLDALVDGLLPQYSTFDGQNDFVRGGTLHEPGDIIRPVSDQTSRLLSVVSFDVFDDQAGPLAAEAIPTGWTSAFMATADHLYVFQSNYSSMSDGTTTDILQFTWNTATGEIRATASGTVPGSTLNQFSADEYEGRLRVATNSSKFVDQIWTAENGVYVLENRGSELAIVGAVTGIAPGENIYSVRFAGDRGFVVTFRQVDPFYTLDLSDPTAPKVVGELKIPGYSSYLQVLDETHVVGIGRVDIGDWQWRVQVSVFDISDFADPRRVGLYTFDETVTGSPAEWEHLAFLWVPSLKLLAFPVNAGRYTPPTGDLPPEAPIVLEDGFDIDGSLGGSDANDALIADGEDDGSAGDGSTDDGASDSDSMDDGSVSDGSIDDSWLRMEKGEPMMVTTTAMPFSSWYGDFEDLSGLAFLRVDFDATDEAAGLIFEGIVRQSGTVRSVWIGEHLYAVASSGILAVDAAAGHELVGSLDFGPEPGANDVPMVFPAVYWRGMEPLMASAGQSVEAAAETAYVDPVISPSPWDDTTLSDVLKAAMTAISEQLATPVESIRLVTAECSGMDGSTGDRMYDLVFSVNGQRHHVPATVAPDGSITIEQVRTDYQFSTQSTTNEWHNDAEPCDVDGDGMVAPIDALNVINELNRKGSYRLGGDRPMRSIAPRSIGRRSAFEPVRIRFDASGDSLIAPIDALIVINRLNSQPPASGQGSNTSGGGGGEGEGFADLGSSLVVDSGAEVRPDSRLGLGAALWGSDAAASWRIDSTVRTATDSSSTSSTSASQSGFRNAAVQNAAVQNAAVQNAIGQAATVRDELLAEWDASSDSSECLGALGDEIGLASVDDHAAAANIDTVILDM